MNGVLTIEVDSLEVADKSKKVKSLWCTCYFIWGLRQLCVYSHAIKFQVYTTKLECRMNEATIFLKQAVIIMCTQSTVILFSMDFPWKRRQVTGYPPTW